jgi:hypothetical protein
LQQYYTGFYGSVSSKKIACIRHLVYIEEEIRDTARLEIFRD